MSKAAILSVVIIGFLTNAVESEIAGSNKQTPHTQNLDPSQVGLWEGPYAWPVVAIHAFLLPTGKVLHYSAPGHLLNPKSYLWDPETWEFTPAPVNRPLFCSGHTFMADGRLMVTGGTGP
ncbi:MAG: hypothetical protein IH914_09535, partial [candidate division Zixibacteria bacterium]|nr:hypothetical protein [candidate division Zixibacteria bacterium]